MNHLLPSKTISLIRLSLVFGLFLSACGPKPAPQEAAAITFACHDYQRPAFEPLVKDFEKTNPTVKVRLVSVDEILDRPQQGNVAVATSDDFGLVAAAADTFIWFAALQPENLGYTLNLQPLIDQDPGFPLDDFFPATLDDLRWQGDLRSLPAEVQPVMFLYDKKIFDEAGLEYPHPGWTWGDFYAAAAGTTTQANGLPDRYGWVVKNYHSLDILLAMLSQQGVSLWDPADPTAPWFTQPEVARTLDTLAAWAVRDQIMPLPTSELVQENDRLIRDGKAAMWVDFISAHVYRQGVGMAPFPEYQAPANPHMMYSYFISSGTAQPAAAWQWLRYLSDHYQPGLEGVLSARRSLSGAALSRWNLDEANQAAVLYALEHPSYPKHALYTPLHAAIASVLGGQAAVEAALENAQQRARDLQLRFAQEIQPQVVQVRPPEAQPTGAATSDAQTITFAPYLRSQEGAYKALAVDFNQSHPGIRVEIVPAVDFTAALPDCFAASLPVQEESLRQMVLNLDPFLQSSHDVLLDDFYPAALASQQEGGQVWGLPYEVDALVVYYNRSLLEQAGVSVPDGTWTIDDFLALAASAAGTPGRFGFTTRSGAFGDLRFALQWLGAGLIDDSLVPPAVRLDTPDAAHALERYAALSRAQVLTPATPSTSTGWPESLVWGPHPARVEGGQAALWIDFIDSYRGAPRLPFPVGAAPLPSQAASEAGRMGPRHTEFLVRAYYISAQAANPQACWDWLTFLSSREETVSLLPARRSMAASPAWQSQVAPDFLPAYLATLEYEPTSLFVPGPDLRWLPYLDPWLAEAYRSVLDGGDAKAALSLAQGKADLFTACYSTLDVYSGQDAVLGCAKRADPEYDQLINHP